MRELCSPINAEFNRIIKDAESIYADYAAASGVSSTVLCVLYSIYTLNQPCTQTQLAEDWGIPRQTINSCLKALESDGRITLEFGEGNRKSKQIRLTASGEMLAQRVIVPLIHAENAALQSLTEEEQRLYVQISRKHNALLRELLSGSHTGKDV